MQNPRNKTQENIISAAASPNKRRQKDYFKRFTRLDIYSYTKDDKIFLGAKPEEVYNLFNGNTSSIKKQAQHPCTGKSIDNITIDQSTLQSYMILALQDFYYNYHIPLHDKLEHIKKKNDERYEAITKSLDMICKHINKKI